MARRQPNDSPILDALMGGQFPVMPLPGSPPPVQGGQVFPRQSSGFDSTPLARAMSEMRNRRFQGKEGDKNRELQREEGRASRASQEKQTGMTVGASDRRTQMEERRYKAEIASNEQARRSELAVKALNSASNLHNASVEAFNAMAWEYPLKISKLNELRTNVRAMILANHEAPRAARADRVRKFRELLAAQAQYETERLNQEEARAAARKSAEQGGQTSGTQPSSSGSPANAARSAASAGGPPGFREGPGPIPPGGSLTMGGAPTNYIELKKDVVGRQKASYVQARIKALAEAEKQHPEIQQAIAEGRAPERVWNVIDAALDAVIPQPLGASSSKFMPLEGIGDRFFKKSNKFIDDNSVAAPMIAPLSRIISGSAADLGDIYYGDEPPPLEGPPDPNGPAQPQLNISALGGGLQSYESAMAALELFNAGTIDESELQLMGSVGLPDGKRLKGASLQFRQQFRDRLLKRIDSHMAELGNKPVPEMGNLTLSQIMEDRGRITRMAGGPAAMPGSQSFTGWVSSWGDPESLTNSIRELEDISKARAAVAALNDNDLKVLGATGALPGGDPLKPKGVFSSEEAFQGAQYLEQSMIASFIPLARTASALQYVPTIRDARVQQVEVERLNSPALQDQLRKGINEGHDYEDALARADAMFEVIEDSAWIEDDERRSEVYSMIGAHPDTVYGVTSLQDDPVYGNLLDDAETARRLGGNTPEAQAKALAILETVVARQTTKDTEQYFKYLTEELGVDPSAENVTGIPTEQLEGRRSRLVGALSQSGVNPARMFYFNNDMAMRSYLEKQPAWRMARENAAMHQKLLDRANQWEEGFVKQLDRGPPPVPDYNAFIDEMGPGIDPLESSILKAYGKRVLTKTQTERYNAVSGFAKDLMGSAPPPEPPRTSGSTGATPMGLTGDTSSSSSGGKPAEDPFKALQL